MTRSANPSLTWPERPGRKPQRRRWLRPRGVGVRRSTAPGRAVCRTCQARRLDQSRLACQARQPTHPVASGIHRGFRPGLQQGFTLLEVMIATALLAVGSMSVIMILATAAGFASKRQESQRLTQVLEEARFEARAMVNDFRAPGTGGTGGTGSGAPAGAVLAVPGGDDAKEGPKPSSLYAGYTYVLQFARADPAVPEAGFRVTVTLEWGDGQTQVEEITIAPDVIPEEEFQTSITYEAERRGTQDRGGTRETK